MRTNRHVPLFFSALIFGGLFLGAACSVPAASPKHAPTKTTPAMPQSISAVGSGFSATLPDPKRPGKMLYELRAASANGQSDANGFHGDMTSLWARLYQKGFPSAILTAPHAQGGSAAKGAGKSVTVTGSGGVVMKSLTEMGTILTADTVVWYASLNRIVATGHVFYHSGKTGATMRAPHMEANTSLKTIYITGGGHGTTVL